MERSFWFRTATVVVTLSAVVYLASALGRLWSFLGDLILIVFFAWLVGSMLIHAVNSLMRIPIVTRPIAILIVYLILIVLLADFALLVIPATARQVIDLANQVPHFLEAVPGVLGDVDSFLARFGVHLGLEEQYQLTSLEDVIETGTAIVRDNAASIAASIASTVFGISLVIVLSFYIVLDGGRRLREALKVLPPRAEREAHLVLRTIDDTFNGYVRGMLIVSLIYGVGTALVMLATGLPAALPVAIISSILLAVPFVGDWLALALPLIVAAIAGDLVTFLIVLATLLFIQQVMLNLLTPRILGHAVRMPAMLVIISVVLGARLAGIWGALLGVPAGAVFYNLAVIYGRRIRERRESREQTATQPAEAHPTWPASDEQLTADAERAPDGADANVEPTQSTRRARVT